MEIVELRVQVEDSQLKKLQADVQALKGTTINLGAGGGGKGSDPTSGTRAGLKATEQQATKTGQSILSVMGKVAKWTAVTTAVYAPIKAFKEAITTIKALDTEMVNIQKVTGATANQMKQYQEQAYSLASQYGRSAMDVAESMTAFARAGYGDQLAQMAELSTLMQNVGYVSADTANSMLLAVDAAWHLNGSQSELMKVMDGVDKITNQNATDFGKMAEGMTVAASVFAESGESIQTFASMVGTGTAVTQRSGSEIARGLRTVLMNIRQIKGETEDGELIDGESIAKASLALKEFAGINTMENGELRKASDILGDLAAKWEDLDSVQQSAIAEALAGKRQANILTALMGNWDMYEKQMEEYATAAGTALKENEIYMDSWAAKSEQLKSKWTEFVSGFVNTDLIKGSLDGIVGVIEFLDSGLGHAAIEAGAFALAAAGIAKAFKGIGAAIKGSALVSMFTGIQGPGMTLFGRLTGGLNAILAAIGPLGIALAGIAAIVATPAIVDFFTTDYAEQGEKISQLTSEYEKLYGVESEFQTLAEKRDSGEGLTDWEQNRLDYLDRYRSELQRTIEQEKELAASKYQEEFGHKDQSTFDEDYYRNGGRGNKENETIDVKNLREAKKAFDELKTAASEGRMSQEEFQQSLDGVLAAYEDFYNATKQGLDEGWISTDDLTQAQKDLMSLYETMQKLRDVPLDKLNVASAIEDFKALTEIGDKSVVNWQKLKQAMEDAGASAEDINATLASMQQDENIVLIDVEADGAEETLNKLKDIGVAVEGVNGTEINADIFSSLTKELGLSHQEAMNLAKQFSDMGVVFTDAAGNAIQFGSDLESALSGAGSPIATLKGQVEELKNSLGSIEDPDITVTATDVASGVVSEVQGKVDALGATVATPQLNAKDNVSGVAAVAKRAIASVPVSHTTTFTGNTSALAGAAIAAKGIIASVQAAKAAAGLATGTQSWKGGPVLLGDEESPDGAPRPELVITKAGKAFVAGMAGPVMTDLPAGSRVFPYSDTVGIMSGRDMTEVQAFGAGNDRILGHYLNPQPATQAASTSSGGSGSKSKSGGSGSKSKSGSTGAKSGGSSKSSGRKSGGGSSGSSGSSSSSGSGTDATLDNLKKELELLQAQYSLLEAQNATTGELSSKSQEIQAKLHQINDHLRATGGEQKDIVDNSTAWVQEQTKQISLREDDLALLRAEYELLEASGADTETLRAKSKEIQNQLHVINELLRKTGGSQKDITENSTAWLEEQKKIQQVQIDVYEANRHLLETESEIMEKQNASAGDRIAKLRKIQDNLHREANYMRSIKADQADINELSIEWLNVQDQILRIQQELMDELDAAVNYKLKLARKERDAELKLIDKQIEGLQKERDIQEDQLSIEEKRKAVEEARIALENAQRQRTVRYYNAATGQWEWAADAKNVASARKTYEQALKDFETDKKDREHDLRIQALELQKEEINSRYDLLEARWEALTDSFADPVRDIKDILSDLLASGKLTAEQVAMVKDLVGDIDKYTLSILSALLTFKEYQSVIPEATGNDYGSYIIEWLDKNGWTEENLSLAQQQIQSSGVASAAALLAAEQAARAKGTTTIGANSSGSAPAGSAAAAAQAAASQAASAKSGSSSSSSKSSSSQSSLSNNLISNAASKVGVSTTTAQTAINSVLKNAYKKYDSGGVLSGLGGIKATAEDEIVVPPEIARFMLKPSANQQFKQRMAELGYLYGSGSLSSANIIGGTQNKASKNHYGDIYNYGSITLSENQARNMTVYELAQKSRGLSVYSAS